MSTKSGYFDKKEVNHGNYSVPHVTEDINEVGPFVQEELDVTPEREGLFLWYIILIGSGIQNSSFP